MSIISMVVLVIGVLGLCMLVLYGMVGWYCAKKKHNKGFMVEFYLQRPDGLEEVRGYTLPRELDGFIKEVNFYADREKKDWGVRLAKQPSLEDTVKFLKGELRPGKYPSLVKGCRL